MSATSTQKTGNILLRLHPVQRIGISLLLSLVTFLLVKNAKLNTLVTTMLIWDVFAFSFVVICWIVFFTRTTQSLREYARKEDGSRVYVISVIILASFASMFTVMLLVLSQDVSNTAKIIYLPISIGGMLLSWIMVHTTFTFHYANLYYDDDEDDPTKHAEGLNFPDEKKPDYIDFAYFAFVIGMTFQVSDVEISSRKIRRTALLHGLLSFGLNTFVVALTVNLVAGLKN